MKNYSFPWNYMRGSKQKKVIRISVIFVEWWLIVQSMIIKIEWLQFLRIVSLSSKSRTFHLDGRAAIAETQKQLLALAISFIIVVTITTNYYNSVAFELERECAFYIYISVFWLALLLYFRFYLSHFCSFVVFTNFFSFIFYATNVRIF